MSYLDLRPSERIGLERAYRRAIRELRRELARNLSGYSREYEDGKEWKIPEEVVSTVLEIFDESVGPNVPPDGFVDLLAGIESEGWRLVRSIPRLTSIKRSDKTRKPRYKKLRRETS